MFVGCALLAGACSSKSAQSPTTVEPTTGVRPTTTAAPVPTTTSPSTTTAAAPAGTTTTATTTTTTIAATTTTAVPPPPIVPAGAQFSPASTLPDGFVADGAPTSNGTMTVIPGHVNSTTDGSAQAAVAESTNRATWQLATMDAASYPAPRGFSINRSGFSAAAAAAGAPGFVAVGRTSFWTPGFAAATRADVVWFSPDGQTWQLIDLRGLVGDGRAIELANVQWVDGQFIVTGADAPLKLETDVSKPLALVSADGANWAELPQPNTVYSSELTQAFSIGGQIVVSGGEYVCTWDAGAFATFSLGRQPRLWSLSADAQTWTPITVPADVLPVAQPTPPDRSGCPQPGAPDTLDTLNTDYTQGVAAIGPAGDSVVVWSSDHTKASVSADLTTWTTADVPGATAVSSTGDADAPQASLISVDNGSPTLISLEDRRGPDESQSGAGLQTITWTFGSGAWTRQPVARPIAVSTSTRMYQVDTSVAVIDDPSNAAEFAPGTIAFSAGGPLAAWGTCTPAAGADCEFATIRSQDLSGADLTGIDLRGAVLGDSNLTGAVLDHALMSQASLSNDMLANSVMTSAKLDSASLSSSNLTGVDLTNAVLNKAYVPASLFAAKSLAGASLQGIDIGFQVGDSLANASLAGLDLTGAYISGGTGVIPMTGVDLQNANLSNVIFSQVDLTGANLQGANLAGIYFSDGVVCPDGVPPTPGTFGPEGCRLH
ncbi:MAG: heterocyst-specific glycolipids-directing protein [Aeromicrobium sp.]|nr:heterocyst-specific glycolipids-directing protein [Aeromicrobium sp.]